MIAANLSVSVDGYFAGPGAGPQQTWARAGRCFTDGSPTTSPTGTSSAEDVLRPELERAGALVMGRDSYETAEAAWGPHPPFENPIFVLTHRPREDDVREGSTFTFVTDGFDTAIERARAAAGEKNFMLHGGTSIQQGGNAIVRQSGRGRGAGCVQPSGPLACRSTP